MTKLDWDQTGDRQYEAGLDRGVLYFPEGGGVCWNGLISLEKDSQTELETVYFDGVKVNEIVTPGDFAGTLKAYTYPDEFLRFEGVIEDQNGILICEQEPDCFHLSYRTKTGSDTNELGDHYKIHLVYNITAIPSTIEYATLTLETEPIEFEWELSTIPEEIAGYRPTAHIVINTKDVDPWLLEDLETILYGSEEEDPKLPPLKALSSYIRNWDRLIIRDNGDGTWTAISAREGQIEMIDDDVFQITDVAGVYLDADTYQINSSEKNEEEL